MATNVSTTNRQDVAQSQSQAAAERDRTTSSLALPQGTKPVYAEQRSLMFGRRFSLSGDLDTDAIDARLTNGVLTVRIPKTAAAQPRRIEVTTG